MAAVICRAICKPFELCGKACTSCCEGCGKCCDEMEKECTKCCGPCCAELNKCFGGCCEYMSHFLEKPFSSLVIFTFLAAFAPAVCLFAFLGDCSSDNLFKVSRKYSRWTVHDSFWNCPGCALFNPFFHGNIYNEKI